MSDSVEIEAAPLAGAFAVYRVGERTPFVTISGPAVSCEVSAGCLLIKVGTDVRYVFSPGQWATVNSVPA